MSINGVDYTKQLAKDREYYQDANKKLRDSTERRVDDTNKRADHVMDKQRENFIQDKTELENNYQKNIDQIKTKTQASIEGNGTKFNEDIEKERENFTQDTLKKSRDFDQRLNDIKSSYSKAFSAEKDRNEDINKTLNSKFTKNVNDIREANEEKLKTYQDKISGESANLQDQYNRERQQLVKSQDDRLTDAYRDSAQKRLALKDRIQTENKKTQEALTAESKNQKQYMQDRMSSQQNKFQERHEAMTKDYGQRSDHLAKSQQQDTIKNLEQISDLRRNHNEDLRLIEVDKRRRDNGSGESSNMVDKQLRLKDQDINDNKINLLKGKLVETQRDYQQRAEREQKSFNATLKEQSIEGTTHLDRKLNEANANKIITVSKEREKAQFEIQNREHQNLLDKSAYEQRLMLERTNSNERLTKLKHNFNSSLKTMEEKHSAGMEDVTKVSNKDKAEFVKKIQETRSNEMFELKREFGKMLDATVQDYEQRLATYQRDNEYLKMTMGQKIHNVIDQTEKQLESQRNLFEDRRAADIKGQQVLMDQRESQLKRNFNEMNHSYQKKIDKMQIAGETKLKLITNDYETKLRELKAMTSKELAAKDTSQQVDIDRIRQTYEEEKTRVVNAYESQITSIQKSHKDQMDQMKSYKRLS